MTSPPGRALGRLVWTVAFIALPARPENTQHRGRAAALGKNKCQHAGCHRQPVFGPKGAARPEWCGQHRLESHIDLRNPYSHRNPPPPPSPSPAMCLPQVLSPGIACERARVARRIRSHPSGQRS